MAPEVMKSSSATDDELAEVVPRGTECDVFSFAVLALYVATGAAPFPGLDNNAIYLEVGMRGGRTPIAAGYAGTDDGQKSEGNYSGFVDLVKQMWQQQPQDRPDFAAIAVALKTIFQ